MSTAELTVYLAGRTFAAGRVAAGGEQLGDDGALAGLTGEAEIAAVARLGPDLAAHWLARGIHDFLAES